MEVDTAETSNGITPEERTAGQPDQRKSKMIVEEEVSEQESNESNSGKSKYQKWSLLTLIK